MIGLILLTSDGRLPNAVLRGMNKQPKVYKVAVDFPITDQDIQRLRVSTIINFDYFCYSSKYIIFSNTMSYYIGWHNNYHCCSTR